MSLDPAARRRRLRRAAALRIVSGGQTGVDRAALDAAILLGLPHGGWCPRGRRAEDGVIPAGYALRQTDTPDYAERTERNVTDADATLILVRGEIAGGTALTEQLCRQHGKPCLVVDLEKPAPREDVAAWLAATGVETLNVAGPRESQRPGIQHQATQYLAALLELYCR